MTAQQRQTTPPVMTAIGLMSGTSLDGIDLALLRTDGRTVAEIGPAATEPYDDDLRSALRALLGREDGYGEVERDLTLCHAQAVHRFLADHGLEPSDVDVLGFHGQTLSHRPADGVTVQIGDGPLLAARTGIRVVDQLRRTDVAAGGQGAPLVPAYHAALATGLERPLAVLNLGGVANVTWIGPGDGDLVAFDTGPANALVDDWAWRHTARPMDVDGRLARAGRVDAAVLARLLDDPYFDLAPPKSLDRDHFAARARALVDGLSPADGAATLTAFSAGAVARAAAHLPAPPRRWLACGGGRRNPALMTALAAALAPASLDTAEDVGWDGDALEAQAFAFLAVRALKGLPLTFPGTTGVAAPLSGGSVHPVPVPG